MNDLLEGRAAWPLYIHGLPGVGKTCAALALSDHLYSCEYDTLEHLCQLRLWYEYDGWESLVDRWKNADVVFLDEIGSRERATDTACAVLQSIADSRVNGGNLAAVYVGNLTPAELHELFNDRIASRLLSGTVIEMLGDDRRFS